MKIDRAKHLLNGEVRRHIAQALVATEPALQRGHMEVAEAITLAIATMECRPAQRTGWTQKIKTALKIY